MWLHSLLTLLLCLSVCSSFNLKVPFDAKSPSIISGQKLVVIKEGEEARLPCAAQAWPKGQYWWYKIANSPFYLDYRIPLIDKEGSRDGRIVQIGGSLKINHATVNDSGKYRCEVNNSEGSDSYTSQLVVLCEYFQLSTIKINLKKGYSSDFVSTLDACFEYFASLTSVERKR